MEDYGSKPPDPKVINLKASVYKSGIVIVIKITALFVVVVVFVGITDSSLFTDFCVTPCGWDSVMCHVIQTNKIVP